MIIRFRTFLLVLSVLGVLIPMGTHAGGSAWIGGSSGTQVYFTARMVTNPSIPGPEVAFRQGSSGALSLGAHSCSGQYYGLVGMTPGQWRGVKSTDSPMVFCLYSWANHAWGGDLEWD